MQKEKWVYVFEVHNFELILARKSEVSPDFVQTTCNFNGRVYENVYVDITQIKHLNDLSEIELLEDDSVLKNHRLN